MYGSASKTVLAKLDMVQARVLLVEMGEMPL